MQEIKEELILKAKEDHGHIKPAGRFTNLLDCFTIHDEDILFWFNDSSNSTKVITRNINAN